MPSYQLYSSRNFPPLSDTLTMLAGLGYQDVEGFGGLYADDAKLADLAAGLKATGLKMPTAHFGLDMLEGNSDQALKIARTLGIKHIYCPYLMPDQRPTDGPGWRAFGARLEAAGRPYKAAGIGFGWHNHDFEFKATPDGAIPQAEILAGGPSLEWEIDVAWVIRGGADPVQWIRRYGPRITAAHVKDIAPAGENTDEDGWADVGHGTVNWASLMAALRAVGCKHFVMEHDNPSDHARFAKRSILALRTN
ncbi:sugar phosphate isomerase/epimerase family protein [Tabrizicola sp. BL-A-41-H6]|uniref:sugar phosphate isomerase/epimerase family protein n=1 Tax=Tabrizicola sp. BL-A-41-H6 TaxID=3421107 RepID=UPI003D66FA5F